MEKEFYSTPSVEEIQVTPIKSLLVDGSGSSEETGGEEEG